MKQKLTFILICFLLCINYDLWGQSGIYIAYQKSDFQTWNELISEDLPSGQSTLKHGFQIGLDHGIGLKNLRIDLYPGVFFRYAYSEQWEEGTGLFLYNFRSKMHQFGLSVQANIYPLDLLSRQSRDCPSFYKGADKFTKGWFLSVKPSLVYSGKTAYPSYLPDVAYDYQTSSKIIMDFAIGTGLDIGITKKISLTPYIMYGFSMGERWNGLAEYFGEPSYHDITQADHLFAGLRLGYWW